MNINKVIELVKSSETVIEFFRIAKEILGKDYICILCKTLCMKEDRGELKKHIYYLFFLVGNTYDHYIFNELREKEVWRTIREEGFEGNYEISNLGRIYSSYQNKIMNPNMMNGYLGISLSNKQKQKCFSVHGLVAKCFVKNKLNKDIVNHINGVKTDVRAINLEYVTQSENCYHSVMTGLSKHTKRVGKFDKETDELLEEFPSLSEAGKKVNLVPDSLSKACKSDKVYGDFKWKFLDEQKEEVEDVEIEIPEDAVNIEGCKDYYWISPRGEVFSEYRLKIIKIRAKMDGNYRTVTLRTDNKRKTLRINRLVAIAFIPNPDNKPQVDHINGITTDDDVSNLRWVTGSENVTAFHGEGNKIEKFDLKGNLLETYCSYAESDRKNNFGKSGTRDACKKEVYKGFVWKFTKDKNLESKISQRITRGKPVGKYDLKGILVEKYNSLEEAGKKNNLSSVTIAKACSQDTYKGNIWKLLGESKVVKKKTTYKIGNPVGKYDLKGVLIEKYISLKEAAEKNKLFPAAISKAYSQDTYKGNIWKFLGENKTIYKIGNPIGKFGPNGNILDVYPSPKKAADEYNIGVGIINNFISDEKDVYQEYSLRHITKKEYISFEKSRKKSSKINRYRFTEEDNLKGDSVAKYDLDDELISVYSSRNVAANNNGILPRTMSHYILKEKEVDSCIYKYITKLEFFSFREILIKKTLEEQSSNEESEEQSSNEESEDDKKESSYSEISSPKSSYKSRSKTSDDEESESSDEEVKKPYTNIVKETIEESKKRSFLRSRGIPIAKYDLKENLIAVYTSYVDAALSNNIDDITVRSYVKNGQYSKYIWKKITKEDYLGLSQQLNGDSSENATMSKKTKEFKGYVRKYSLKKVLIATYKSVTEAARQNNVSVLTIKKNLLKEKAGDFIWKQTTKEEYSL